MQDAIKTEADGAIERMKDEMRKQSIDYAAIDRNDPATVEDADKIEIDVKGVPPTKTTAFRNLISERFTQWTLTPVNATDYRLNMRPSELVTLKRDTVERSLQTISNRINQLGLTEPTVQQYGQAGTDYEILVELAGRGRSGAREGNHADHRATGNRRGEGEQAIPSREAALAAKGGILPLGTKLVQSRPPGDGRAEWYLVSKTPVIRGTDLRNARAGQDDMRKWDTQFTLSPDAGKTLRPVHRVQYRKLAGGGDGQPDLQRGGHQGAHRG